MTSFPLPTGPLAVVPTVHPRPLSPLQPSPARGHSPGLPSVPRSPAFASSHTITTHIIPAAFPRCPSVLQSHAERTIASTSKAERRARIKRLSQDLLTEKAAVEVDTSYAGLSKSSAGLWSTMNRIVRNAECEEGKTGITLVALHPIGFHKETWEKTFESLITATEMETSPVRIEEIWSIEAVHHGDTGRLNEPNLPKFFDRADYARDVLNFCISYMPSSPRTTALDLHLPEVEQQDSRRRVHHGYDARTVVGLGHSMGSDALARAAIQHPQLFSACILLEPTIFPVTSNSMERSLAVVAAALGRRSTWPSREEARAAFSKQPAFRAFHPAVLESYVNYALHEDPATGEVHLKTTPFNEASEFCELRVNNEVWELLPSLDERVELLWVMGGKEATM